MTYLPSFLLSGKPGLVHTFKIDRSPRLNRSDPIVREALQEFGGSSGIRPCFTETREEIVALISSKHPSAGLLLGGVEGMVHDVSSEIIHGSYHGYRLFSGLHNGQRDQAKNLAAHFETVLFSVCLSTAALARSVRRMSSDPKAMEGVSDLALRLLLPYVPDEMKAPLEEILFDPNDFG